ncbi:uncharacterized protein LOC108630687 isoform X2 [Ceratina calcarata]|uniref:Uncharacterized protein LOC108630687 isoform X2 n=1 Tax=Ceratina calcarata TaxID=156304 RepID=A0AAJ7SAW9_9HYME|nr:uncharacterized protein LOC108630687 isoform X2 [Ceratina calcarata]
MIGLENFDSNEGAEGEDWEFDDEYSPQEQDSLKLDEKKEFALGDKYYSSITRKPEDATISQEFLEFFHSYGYDCRKYFNLCVIDPQTIAFAASNLIQFVDFEENKVWFKIGSKGNGIGHMTKNPVHQHIAVGANETNPTITIYNWPLMQTITALKGGTTKRYFHLAYSPDGSLLASQGGEPDYFISLWNWRRSTIILQCKSHVHDVYNVTFSKYVPGQLTTSGVGHIKFWKMSRTFTGLKLKGEIGKFGNTEISDIIAIHPMPDETVISGCEWGNMFLWDESLIKLETCRRNKEKSHAECITQFEYISGELISVGNDKKEKRYFAIRRVNIACDVCVCVAITGSDGWIRFWFYDTIDHADLADDEQYLEIQPIYEFEIADEEEHRAMLMCIRKQEPDKPEKTHWYAQDGNGGLWLLDLCTSKKEQEQKKIFTCHAGPVVDMDTADWGPFVATLDSYGNLHIYDYIGKKLILIHKFRDRGSQVVWLPCEVERTGTTLVCGFENGIIRMISVDVKPASVNDVKRNCTTLIQVIKPHSERINVMSLNESRSLLVTGSNDATIFVLKIDTPEHYPTILPIGYVKVPSSVSCVSWWNPREEATLLIGCLKGDFVEVKLPTEPQPYTKTTYELVKCKPVSFKFESVKSSIEREAVRIRHEEEMERLIEEKRKEMEQLMAENPHIIIDEETFLMDIEEREMVLPEIYIPEVPNKVLQAQYSVDGGDVWLFMGGFDAGYVYEYPRPLSGKLKHGKPVNSRIIECAKDTEIHNFFFDENREYMFLGTEHGELHVVKVKKRDPLDFSNCLIVPIHDYYNGHMSKILLSYDRKMLITCGRDGNIFSFKVNEESIHGEHDDPPTTLDSLYLPQKVEDIEDVDHPNLEEVITRTERNRIMALARKRKKQVLDVIRDLTEEYTKITTRNKYLLRSQQISQFELDPRIVEDLEQQLKSHKTLTQQKLEFKVEKSKMQLEKLTNHFVTPVTRLPFAVYGILNEERLVHSVRELKLDTDSISRCVEMLKRQERREKTGRVEEGGVAAEEEEEEEKEEEKEAKPELEMKQIEYLEGLLAEDFSDLTTGLGLQINQTLAKYKESKARLTRRRNEWKKLHEKKPNLAKSRAKDEATLETAKETIGEFHLKINQELSSTRKKETAATKYKEFVNCRTKVHNLREGYNSRLKAIAVEKERLQKEIVKLTEVLKRIHIEVPLKHIRPSPQPPKLDVDVEFPEHNLELGKYVSMSEKMEQVKRQRQSLIVDQLIDHSDLEYEALYCDDKGVREEQESVHSIVISSKTKIKDHPSIAADVLRSLNVSDSVQTPWERDAKRSRLWRRTYEQDCVLRYIESSYEKLENELDELEEYRLDVIYQSTYMNLNLLTLYEEFIILRESETTELALEDKVNQRSNERSTMMHKIQATNVHIAAREEEIRRLQVKIKDTTAEFAKAVADDKFHDFLQKIYKRKYTAAKRQNDESDSATQSSDTSTEESDGTIDTEAEYIPFDENVCPPGCEKELYDMAFSTREKRYAYEFRIKEEQREIEMLQKELDTDSKHLRIIENNVKSSEEELQIFVLQHTSDSGSVTDIHNCVLFNRKELAKLYARVGELQEETFNLEDKRKKSEIHLKRIKYDLKYMQTQNGKLEGDIKEKMIQKLGQRVSLINLYETILQRLIYDTKTDVQSLMKNYAKKIKDIKWDYNEGLGVLKNLIRENTEKLSLLTVLEKEKYKLTKILEQPLVSEESMVQIEMEHKADIAVLQNILYDKMQQKQMLQYDIQSLKTGGKARKLPPICLEQSDSYESCNSRFAY